MSPWIRILGILPAAFYVTHAWIHTQRGTGDNVLWACTIGCLLAGLGMLAAHRTILAVALLWLALGSPLWIMDLVDGGEFMPTSTLTHGGGLLLALIAIRQAGFPRGAWWKGVVALLLLQAVTRLVTGPGENVNLAHGIWKGWESRFYDSYMLYLSFLLTLSAGVFFVLEKAIRRWSPY